MVVPIKIFKVDAVEQNVKTVAASEADQAVGARIRRLRKARGRKLAEVAEICGLSESYLSQIERGISSASIRILARLADALDVGIAELFPGGEGPENRGPIKIARMTERKHVDFAANGISKEVLTPFDQSPRLDIYIMNIAVGGSSGEAPFTHQGEEAGFVLEGGIELEVGGQREILAEGDSFRFCSTEPHRYRNAGTRPAKAVWINYREK